MHGTTFVSYSRFAIAANLRGRGLSQFSPSCYSETAPFQDGEQLQIHSHDFYLTIATMETSPGLGDYATCRFLVLADGLKEKISFPSCSRRLALTSERKVSLKTMRRLSCPPLLDLTRLYWDMWWRTGRHNIGPCGTSVSATQTRINLEFSWTR